MDLEYVQVGQKKSEWVGLADGYIMEYNEVCGLVLYLFFRNPLPQEEMQIKAETPFKITFTDYGGVGFFCVKFGSLPWGDCAFSPNLYQVPPRFEFLEDGCGYALNVVLIDTTTGTIKALRQIGLGTVFSRMFRDWCEESLRREMNQSLYHRIVNDCYKEYDTEQLVRQAKLRYEISPHREEMGREQ